MEFADAVTFFHTDPVYDAYTGALLFYGQTVPRVINSPGATSRQRTLETAPGTTLPARRAVRWYGSAWIVGNSTLDSYDGDVVKTNFDMKLASDTMTYLTPGQATLGQAGTAFYAHKEYNGDRTDPVSSSDYDTMWAVYCATSEPLSKGTFLNMGGTLLRVRNTYVTHEDFRLVEADQFDDDTLQTAVFNTGSFSLRNDSFAEGNSPVQVIQTDVPKFYEWRTAAESGMQAGDRTVFVAQSSLTPKPGMTFTMLGRGWRALSVVPDHDAWAIHARPA